MMYTTGSYVICEAACFLQRRVILKMRGLELVLNSTPGTNGGLQRSFIYLVQYMCACACLHIDRITRICIHMYMHIYIHIYIHTHFYDCTH